MEKTNFGIHVMMKWEENSGECKSDGRLANEEERVKASRNRCCRHKRKLFMRARNFFLFKINDYLWLRHGYSREHNTTRRAISQMPMGDQNIEANEHLDA